MGVPSAVTVRCWKLHTCVNCGSKYRYQIQRTSSLIRPTQEAADADANRAALTLLERTCDVRPCPECGTVQPEMFKPQTTLLLAQLAVTAGLGFLTWHSANSEKISIPVVTLISLVTTGVVGFCLIYFIFRALNSDLNANLNAARNDILSGITELVERKKAGAAFEKRKSPGATKAIVLIVVTLSAIGGAEALRVAMRWPMNDDFFPPVAGPGDVARFHMRQVPCLNNGWAGLGDVRVQNTVELGVLPELFRCRPHDELHHTIQKGENSDTWISADIEIPDLPGLQGKTMKFTAALGAIVNVKTNVSTYQQQAYSVQKSGTLVLASTRAGTAYYWLWIAGMIFAIAAHLYLLVQASNADGLRRMKSAAPPELQPLTPSPSNT